MDQLDIDPSFEPQQRARSNTWPLPRPDNFVDPDGGEPKGGAPLAGEPPKKNSSRRNAWGNMSYADLITQAIQSSPEQRLTLAQIYEWMVQNVAYFKDKGDSNSSAGWKNSIRHNLSLHNRFMRVQNEGTGKSSWWMINPDAKPGKAARRRAASMETSKYEKKRGRVKKKVEALRNGATPSPSSSVSEGHDLFPDSPPLGPPPFQLSPDFRPRASSNASSCGGRLSPIPAAPDGSDLADAPWHGQPPEHLAHMAGGYDHGAQLDRFTTDNLVKSLAESMKLRNGGDPDGAFARLAADCAVKTPRPTPAAQMNSSAYLYHYNGSQPDYAGRQPPAYHQDVLGAALAKRPSPPQQQQQQVIEGVNGRTYNALGHLQGGMSGGHVMQTGGHLQQQQQQYREASFLDTIEPILQPQQQLFKTIKEERLSPLLGTCNQQYMVKEERVSPGYPSQLGQLGVGQQQQHQQAGGHLVGHLLYNPFPQDLDFEPLPGGLECDVDQVIRHELSVDGNLDFNFPEPGSAAVSNTANGQHQVAQSRNWVH